MKQTDNLKLNLFENSDPVLAQYFNENSTKLDAAITEAKALTETRYKANKQSIDSLTVEAVTTEIGTYTGDGSSEKTLTFTKKPLLVFLMHDGVTYLCFRDRACAVSLHPTFNSCVAYTYPLTWSDTSVTISHTVINTENKQYTYLALVTA